MATHPELVEVEGLPVEVIRTGRQKTAAVRVREGRVVIAVPRLLPRSRIEALLARKAGWIKKKLLQQSGYKEEKPREYVSGRI